MPAEGVKLNQVHFAGAAVYLSASIAPAFQARHDFSGDWVSSGLEPREGLRQRQLERILVGADEPTEFFKRS